MRLALGGELVDEWLKDLPLSPRQRDVPAAREVTEFGVVAEMLAEFEVQ